MSNPISSLHETDETPTDATDTTDTTEANPPELEVDEVFGEADSIPPLEIDPLQDDRPEASEGEQTADPTSLDSDASESKSTDESKSRAGLIALILAVLLVVSVAINLKQSRDVGALEAKSAEFEQALTVAVERIDVETARANGAEAALDRVDSAVDLVNEKVLGLQEALDGLREATLR